MPHISVVIPCWNAERTLAETLRSVQSQSFGDFEVIALDDGSTDRTSKILADFADRDSRFRHIALPNGGPSRARNIGVFKHAAGTYVAFLDSDDLWSRNMLERMAEALGRDDAPDGLYARVAFFRDSPAAASSFSTVHGRQLTPNVLLRENPICTMSNLVVRADCFRNSGGFDPKIVHGEDVEWLIRLTAAGARIEALDETLVYYRASPFGLSADLDAMRWGWRMALATVRNLGVDLSEAEVRAAEAVHLRYLARRALRVVGPRGKALRFALTGLRKSPAAFFAPPRRGGLTLIAALLEPVLPVGLRRAAFAEQSSLQPRRLP
jgi:glycosyltransferase involved in cell wall biosynthesis